jgi:hypothetical protein
MHWIGVPHMPEVSQYWTAELPEHCESYGLQVPWHDAMPPFTTHAEFVQAMAALQFPFCTPWAEHWVDPGTHCPMHVPPTHAEFAQATGDPYDPLALQVSTPLFEHVVAAGAHDPTHAPLTQAWFEHATALLHWPSGPHVWTPLPEHFVVPGTHTPLQAPFTQP